MRHQGKIAVVTGAARGLGFSIAEVLAREGAQVLLVDRSENVTAAAEELGKGNLKTSSFVSDLADVAAPKEIVKCASARYGKIDILINNAGIAPKHNGVKAIAEHISFEEWSEVIQVNLTSVFLMCKEVAPIMRHQKWGRIVNMASVAGRAKSEIASASYCASKAGVIGLSRVLANELGPAGICVNCIAPGRIATPLAAVAGDKVNNDYIKLIPVGRLGESKDVALAASFLASDDAAFINGTVLDVNGGSFMI